MYNIKSLVLNLLIYTTRYTLLKTFNKVIKEYTYLLQYGSILLASSKTKAKSGLKK